MKYNKLPYKERVRHAAYRDTQYERVSEMQIRKEIKRMERDKMQSNEPPMTDKEREFQELQERAELLRILLGGIDEDEVR